MTPEGKVKAKVKRALDALPRRYRFMPVQNGMGAPGLDFYNCICGWFIAIETKVPGAKLTDRQQSTAEQIAAAGGVVFVIRDQEDIDFMMGQLKHPYIFQGVIYDKLQATERRHGEESARG